MPKFLMEKINSDKAAVGTTETVILIALSIFALLAVARYIFQPMAETSKGIGEEIKAMNPR